MFLKMNSFRPVIFLLSILFCSSALSQQLTRDQVKDTISQMPGFSIYKNNYFISGIPLHTNISEETADAKYQISFKQLLTRKDLPLDSFIFFTYTQQAFWTIYEFSSPFEDINFKPGIALGAPIFKNDRLLGMAFLRGEHESNGRDSIYSRSWNSISLGFHAALNPRTTISFKARFPFGYKEDNPDLLEYIGPGELNFTYDLKPDKVAFEVMLRKGWNWEWKGAFSTRLFYRPFEMRSHHIMLEWFHGYAENLLNYTDFTSMIRFGWVVKSDEFNFLKPVPAQEKL